MKISSSRPTSLRRYAKEGAVDTNDSRQSHTNHHALGEAQIESRIIALEEQVARLDRLKRDIVIAISIFSVLSLAFFGLQWKQIGNTIERQLDESGLAKAKSRLEAIASEAEGNAKRVREAVKTAKDYDIPNRIDSLSTEVDSIGRRQLRTDQVISVTEGRPGWERVKRCPEGEYVAGVGGRGGGGGEFCYNCVDIIQFVCEPFRIPAAR
jgi:hypothetical protein